MRKVKTFNVGDKVFAKVKGYPAWPARILTEQGKKYSVQFYGTGETGNIKVEDLFYYLKYKKQFVKTSKRKDYNDAIEEIERAIEKDGTDGNDDGDTVDNSTSLNTTPVDNVDNKKGIKRKRLSSADKSVDESQPKQRKNLGRKSSTVDSNADSQESIHISEEETKNNSSEHSHTDIVSRSGRKIKSKKFSDDDDSEEKSNGKPVKNKIESHHDTKETDEDTDFSTESKNKSRESHDLAKNVKAKSITYTVRISEAKIITESYLNALIAYAEHVKTNEEFYRTRPVEERSDSVNEVIIAKLPNGNLVGIKLNKECPPPCNSEYERVLFEESQAKTTLSLKSLVEKGTCQPTSDSEAFIMDLDMNEEDIQQKLDIQTVQQREAKLHWLKIESNLVELDAKIKACLGLDKADPRQALKHMDAMLELDINNLMLKKHPHVVDMVRRLRRYIGNVKEWDMSGDTLENFEAEAEKIRDKADDVYQKFTVIFNIKDENLFWDQFNEHADEFRKLTSDMKESHVFALCAEPYSRQAFLDRQEDDEEMQLIMGTIDKTVANEIGSSKVSDDNMHLSESTSARSLD